MGFGLVLFNFYCWTRGRRERKETFAVFSTNSFLLIIYDRSSFKLGGYAFKIFTTGQEDESEEKTLLYSTTNYYLLSIDHRLSFELGGFAFWVLD